eukprot:4752532-Pleurochrysis_carterae.AAC.1
MSPDPPPNDDEEDKPQQGSAFADGSRVRMNFKPGGQSWYRGTEGGVSEHGLHVGFHDGELRFFKSAEARGLTETGLMKELDGDWRLIDNARVDDKACVLTTFKEGRMSVARMVGVLVGQNEPGLGSMVVHCAHYVDTDIFSEQQASVQSTRRRSA